MKLRISSLLSFALLAACSAQNGHEDRAGSDVEPSDVASVGQAVTSITNDLNVAMIQRFPRLDYVLNSTNPKVEGWPAVNAPVTWRGTLRNFSNAARTVAYVWKWDGTTVASGNVTIPASTSTTVGSATVDYQRPWLFERHNLQLSLDTNNIMPEIEESNNQVTVVTDALAVGFYVEQSIYDYFNAHQREMVGAHSNSWEDWAQRQISGWNQRAAAAVYPGDVPNGVLDRFRLDEIVIVPDQALPLVAGGIKSNSPNLNDRSVDVQWGFANTLLTDPNDPTFYTKRTLDETNNAFYYEGSLFHEIGHARYLVDTYGFRIFADPGLTDVVAATENGASVVGTNYLPLLPGTTNQVYETDEQGLMHSDYSRIDSYSAMALNRIAGRRAVNGNYNAPANIAEFMNELPQENEIALKDATTGAALAGAQVQIFRSVRGTNSDYYKKFYDATADLTVSADSAGKVRVGHNPFSTTAFTWLHESTTMLLRIAHNNRVRYMFMEVADFNKEYWRGHTALGQYSLPVDFKVTTPGRLLPLRIEAESFDRYNDTTAGNTGGACTTPTSGNVDMSTTTDPNGGTCNVGWTQPGEWLEYDVNVTSAQRFDIVSRVASGVSTANFHIELDGVTVGGTQNAPNYGWQSFADRVVPDVLFSAGAHKLRVVFETQDVNLNYISVLTAQAGVSVPSRLQAEDYARALDSSYGNTGGSCRSGDADFQTTTDTGGGCNLGWSTTGEWLEFDINVSTARSYNIVSRVASGLTGRQFRVDIDGAQVGAVQTTPSAGWQAFGNSTVSTGTLSVGKHRLRVTFLTPDINLNYIDVQ